MTSLRMTSAVGAAPLVEGCYTTSVPNTPCPLPPYTAYVHVGRRCHGKLGKPDKFRVYKVLFCHCTSLAHGNAAAVVLWVDV